MTLIEGLHKIPRRLIQNASIKRACVCPNEMRFVCSSEQTLFCVADRMLVWEKAIKTFAQAQSPLVMMVSASSYATRHK